MEEKALVGIIMGSSSDWETMEHVAKTLAELGVPHETRVVSAHRTPDLLFEYASEAEKRGIEVVIAGAGGAAHLPGMTAAKTVLPVLGVPVESKALKGLDSLLSIAQMPGGIPVGTLGIGKAGAINAALLAAAILGGKHSEVREAVRKFREAQTAKVLANRNPAAGAVVLAGAGGASGAERNERRKARKNEVEKFKVEELKKIKKRAGRFRARSRGEGRGAPADSGGRTRRVEWKAKLKAKQKRKKRV